MTWKEIGWRALKTMCQSAVALIPMGCLTDVDWLAVAGTAVLAGIVSALNNIIILAGQKGGDQ